MNHYVYIIYSLNFDTYYKGYSLDPLQRLAEHNANKSKFTARKGPWILVHLEVFSNKSLALKREAALKKYDHRQLIDLINSTVNQLNSFLSQ